MSADRAAISAAIHKYVLTGMPPSEFMRTTYAVVPSTNFDDRTAAGGKNSYMNEHEACEAADALNTARPLGEDDWWVVDEVAWIRMPNGEWVVMPNGPTE